MTFFNVSYHEVVKIGVIIFSDPYDRNFRNKIEFDNCNTVKWNP